MHFPTLRDFLPLGVSPHFVIPSQTCNSLPLRNLLLNPQFPPKPVIPPRIVIYASRRTITLAVVFIVSPVVSLSRVSPSLPHLLALRYRKPAFATLAASLSMARCRVQLNSYSISALFLAHRSPISSPPPASIAAGTRHESRGQACGPREQSAISKYMQSERAGNHLHPCLNLCVSMPRCSYVLSVSSTLKHTPECRLQTAPRTRGSV